LEVVFYFGEDRAVLGDIGYEIPDGIGHE
jgi:hypothetical protein